MNMRLWIKALIVFYGKLPTVDKSRLKNTSVSTEILKIKHLLDGRRFQFTSVAL